MIRAPFGAGSLRPSGAAGKELRKYLIGEVAERSKALDWNSSNIFTGVRGFESHPLRHRLTRRTMVARIGFSATTSRESRQGRKAAAAAAMSGAGA
jgi:hypothetical protein